MGSSVDQCAVLALLFVASVIPQTSAQIAWDAACGISKGCFPNCPGGCSEYLVTWSLSGSTLTFNMKAVESDSSKYLAIAFSDDYRMGDDSVAGCLPSSGQVLSYYNEGTETEALSPATLGVTTTTAALSSGVIECDFTRALTASDPKFFDLNSDDYYIQLVLGEGEGSGLGEHHGLPWFSASKVDFNGVGIYEEYKLNSPLVKLHAIMMIFAWLLFSLVGMMTARYNKDMLPEKKLFGTKVWFQVHRALMLAVVVCLVIGFIPIFVEIEGYSQIPPPEGEGYTKAHPVLGIIVTAAAFVNPIAALLRPGPDHKFRWIFNWGHLALGAVTQFLAILCVFFGYVLERSELGSASPIVTGIQMFFIAVFVVALEVNVCLDKKNKGSVEDVNMANVNHSNPDFVDGEKKKLGNEPKKSNLPFIALIAFSVVMFCFTIAVLGIIAAS